MTLSMLTAIQQMQFYLRTAFGDSDNAIGSRIHLRTQGFMQGNGASPAGWTVVSIAILQAHKNQGHGATFLCPVSEKRQDLACILYVDDTDILHLCQDQGDTVYDAHTALQNSVTSWGNLLIATGGHSNPRNASSTSSTTIGTPTANGNTPSPQSQTHLVFQFRSQTAPTQILSNCPPIPPAPP